MFEYIGLSKIVGATLFMVLGLTYFFVEHEKNNANEIEKLKDRIANLEANHIFNPYENDQIS